MTGRSEYRMSPIRVSPESVPLTSAHPTDEQRDALAAVLLDAYRDTIDDEGETLDDAFDAIDHYVTSIIRPHSFVVLDGPDLIAFAFVLIVDGTHYIDPVAVASAQKRRGVGRASVRLCLRSLADAGVADVGATITDGNVASERLFTGLGFSRHGAWPPAR